MFKWDGRADVLDMPSSRLLYLHRLDKIQSSKGSSSLNEGLSVEDGDDAMIPQMQMQEHVAVAQGDVCHEVFLIPCQAGRHVFVDCDNRVLCSCEVFQLRSMCRIV